MKIDAFDLLLAAIDSQQTVAIDLPDGRQCKVTPRNGEARVQIVANAKLQSDIARARFRILYGE